MNQRKKSNIKLPPRVYKDRSRYYYRPYLGREKGKPKFGTPIRLCGLDASIADVWQAYENLINKDNNTLDWLLSVYLKSDQYKSLSLTTQNEYRRYADIIANYPLTNGRRFGEAPSESFFHRLEVRRGPCSARRRGKLWTCRYRGSRMRSNPHETQVYRVGNGGALDAVA